MSVGHVICGGILSATETVNEHDVCRPALSVVVHEMAVDVPERNTDPDTGSQIVLLIPDASDGVGVYVTVALGRPAGGIAGILAGHVMFGLVVSDTVTANEHEADSCEILSVVVQTTVVVALRRKLEPEDGIHDTLETEAVGAYVVETYGDPDAVGMFRDAGQDMVGGLLLLTVKAKVHEAGLFA